MVSPHDGEAESNLDEEDPAYHGRRKPVLQKVRAAQAAERLKEYVVQEEDQYGYCAEYGNDQAG